MALGSNLSSTDGLDPRTAHARNRRHLQTLRKSIVGPIPFDVFFERALGNAISDDRDVLLSSTNAFKSVPSTANTPEEIYEPLIVALNKQTKYKSRCPGFVFENTARRSSHPKHPGYAKPHISCVSRRNAENVRRLDRRSRSELGYAELIIQATPDAAHDLFTDPPPDLEVEQRASFDFVPPKGERQIRQEAEDAFGLHVAFIVEIFARQHRNHCHSISVAGSRARLYRWDRAGCIVSEAFDIREHPEILCEFLWRFSRTTDAMRGHDRTVMPATLEMELRFRDAIKDYVRSQLGIDVFLKDTWRVESDGGVEGDLLAHFDDLGVRNVPEVVTYGDVPDYIPNERHNVTIWQTTHTAGAALRRWACRIAGQPISVTDVQRYRLVLGTVGYGISTIKGTEELLHATYDAFTAMRDAHAKDSRIHRDISVGNIILVKEPGQDIRRGYLIDWEASSVIDATGESLQPGRAGTWHFMSWRMLDRVHANSKHTFLDDMESLVHLVLYCALLYLSHALEKEALLQAFHEYFEAMGGVPPGPAHGGDLKCRTAHDRGLIREAQFGSASLAEWLTTMLEMQCPPGWRTEGYNYGKCWTPEHVDAFWSEFLRTHTLERDDRVVHDVTKVQRYDYDELSVTAPTAPPTPVATPALTRKRSAAERDLPEGEHDSKRRRSVRLQGVLAPSPGAAPPRTTDGPRRSERIKVIQDRAGRLPVPTTRTTATTRAAAPAATSSSAAARASTRGRGRGRGRVRK
ncbi:uncharacterized protein TRAVEDRAFT_71650 [Trametes versicolor FP-101664 SS1]|uniref:uncharacterized protein n=1 Tax=Trametes versicolor (strain FP-101664) TaxID=717944 RepID=UPI0004623BB2|nr:uncharacterized protein TRAVEDRAFT_71650 [Trametes versicolor FP-101664 SS1]EIW59668.1 hypothetical protein TRAVEDRAFT_71650 [Trametes versicolor FP-101664 SS1]